MPVLIASGFVFLVLAIVFLRRTLSCTRRGRFLAAGGSCVSGIASAAIATLLAVVSFSYLTYTRLTDEQLVSRIEFTSVAPFEFRARLMIEGQHDQFFLLTGDEWQLDARLVSWKAPITILGLEPIYRLDRLSGRYRDVDLERSEPRTVHALSADIAFDVWNIANRLPWLVPGVDAQYGAATYVPMLDGALYEVSLSRDALIARPANDLARAAVSGWH